MITGRTIASWLTSWAVALFACAPACSVHAATAHRGLRVVLCAGGTKGLPNTERQAISSILRARLAHGFDAPSARLTWITTRCLRADLPTVRDQPRQIRQAFVPGAIVLADSGGTYLPQGETVILRCKVAGCAPGARLGTTDVTAPTPILQVIVPNQFLQPGSAFAHRFRFDGQPAVSFRLRGAGRIDWCTFTAAHQGSYTAPVLDNKVLIDLEIVAPVCEATIPMPGLATMQEAKAVASYINSGPLPAPLSVVSTRAIGR
jgi:hypothetical protein